MMNRQIRRAQAKQDKKAEREKDERREARKRKVAQLRAKRAERRTAAKTKPAAAADGAKGASKDDEPASAKGGRKPGRRAGRFAGALTMATVFFIVLQSSVPPMEGDNELLRSITGGGFFLLFGYFSAMWLMRRGAARAMTMTWITGGLLLVGVEVTKALQGVVPFDPLMVALAAPGIVGGSYLGRLVFENTPA